ncbi:Proline dehydrogenase / Delta-1-pyrroline-5-carboxylate dehydrogenase [Azospirillaceae bacterium]
MSKPHSSSASDINPRVAITQAYRADEEAVVEKLLAQAHLPVDGPSRIADRAARLLQGEREVLEARARGEGGRRECGGGLDNFPGEFGLSDLEGVALMCLAEALLRAPDADTARRLIRDQTGDGDWSRYVGQSDSLYVNASSWALLLTGRSLGLDEDIFRVNGSENGRSGTWIEREVERVIARGDEPEIRQALLKAMRIFTRQFVIGRTITEALERVQEQERVCGVRHVLEVLSEAARTRGDATQCFNAHQEVIAAIGTLRCGRNPIDAPGLTIKLSSLHPRLDFSQRDRVILELAPRLIALAQQAKEAGLSLTIDAEEAERLEPILDLFSIAYSSASLQGWDGLGLAVQAYQKRALSVLDWLEELARRYGRRISVRLVKGAYWSYEIKRAQELGLDGYPVFTRKASTDLSYLVCARRLLARRDLFFPQFATHNAYTMATILEMVGHYDGFEFQRFHGMSEALHQQVSKGKDAVPCRVYAPVGGHVEAVNFLTRRLLENGANTTFVKRARETSHIHSQQTDAGLSPALPHAPVFLDPVSRIAAFSAKANPDVRLPIDMHQPERLNSAGVDLSDPLNAGPLLEAVLQAGSEQWIGGPIITGRGITAGSERLIHNPADSVQTIGSTFDAAPVHIDQALGVATRAAREWASLPVADRAACLDRAAELFERDRARFIALLVRETGKTIPDALAETREAVDLCRYYAAQARRNFSSPVFLPGPTGEVNRLSFHGRGVFACFSAWASPLAAFVGQIVAALVAGNAVVAKPAAESSLVSTLAVRLLFEAGAPPEVLHLVIGDRLIGERLVGDSRIAGVAFTGSTAGAGEIQRILAAQDRPMIPFIAQTSAVNAVIIDATAPLERAIDDVIAGAFRFAGQGCASARILFIEDSVADRAIRLLSGIVDELRVGDPFWLDTDVGPVISTEALFDLLGHAGRLKLESRRLFEAVMPADCSFGNFIPPQAYEVVGQDPFLHEIRGPILQVIRFAGNRLDQVLDVIAQSRFTLALGVHSRIERRCRDIWERLAIGNIYVNRSIVEGAAGERPFGGVRCSGTGPKVGGPNYLSRFIVERMLTLNTAALGGVAALTSLSEDR